MTNFIKQYLQLPYLTEKLKPPETFLKLPPNKVFVSVDMINILGNSLRNKLQEKYRKAISGTSWLSEQSALLTSLYNKNCRRHQFATSTFCFDLLISRKLISYLSISEKFFFHQNFWLNHPMKIHILFFYINFLINFFRISNWKN